MKNVNKCLMVVILILTSTKAMATMTDLPRTTMSALDSTTAETMIKSQTHDFKMRGLSATDLEPERNQLFKLVLNATTLYYIPTLRKSRDGDTASWVCSVLLFNQERKIISAHDVLGSGGPRPWTCDGLSAVSFSDRYDDGSVLVIAIYDATAPSSERFTVPIVMKMSFSPPSLLLDEELTRRFDDIDVPTIKKARSLLPQKR